MSIRRVHASCVMNTFSDFQAGDVVEIAGGQNLPFGLGEGLQVRLIRMLEGTRRLVERDGREWIVEATQLRSRLLPRQASQCRTATVASRDIRPHRSPLRAWMPSAARARN